MNDSNSLLSYERYLERLGTFEMFKWFGKSKEFSPIECAKRGWINLARDCLKCVSCSKIIYNHDTSSVRKFSKVSNECLKLRILKLNNSKCLVDEHNNNCPWRTVCVSDKLIQVDIYNEDLMYKQFLNRVKSFKNCSRLPLMDDNIFQIFTQLNNNDTENKPELLAKLTKQKTILILACCGWSYIDNKDQLKCEKCLRSIGLWLYKNDISVIENDDDQDEQEENQTTSYLASADEMDHSSFLNMIFAKPYSDQVLIKYLIDKLVNLVAVEQDKNESNLLDTCKDNEHSNKKRKMDELDETSTTNEFLIETTETRKKKFNPIDEHFNWCPWLIESERTNSYFDKTTNKMIAAPKSSIVICHDVLIKELEKGIKKGDYSKQSSLLKSNYSNLNNDQLLEKIKSVQSLLINCSSTLSLN